jgi:hypothetical protein
LHWGVLDVIGKVLKRRYRKWRRIGHLDICSPSYGQKKGSQSPGTPPETPPGTISGLQLGSPGKKWHSGVGAADSHRVYYRE